MSAPNSDQVLLPTMTANVRIVTDQKESVLKVPNAALRFRPPGVDAETQRPGAAGSRPGGGPGQGREGAGRAAIRGRVWVLGPDDKPRQISIQLGITDGTFTEVAGGDLTEGQQVIVGQSADRPSTPGSGGSAAPRLRL